MQNLVSARTCGFHSLPRHFIISMTTYYDAISKKANKFANMLKNFGIHKGRFIYAIVDDAELLWIAELGTLRFNCLFGAMPISTPEKRIKEILLESKAQLILIDA